ncbi:hypothetical protein HJC23_002466 [Cyclotella cryptica]|uniref:Glycosyltransferase 2-like domain-containing protein n=1 Tax=Cyclotella cryptica TaxID=29204 RepID=A0ABD3NFE6_9STRA|eukprot:CCRYP_021118-RA/>CCRYP_021118-RA protein AED:0.42 eAED:0.42 QI:0/-1/0/1/-1/1/1/0/544
MSFLIKVDVIIAVHNAESTIEETVRSAMNQVIPDHLLEKRLTYTHANDDVTDFSIVNIHFDVLVCCYNDASTDKSLEILHRLEHDFSKSSSADNERSASAECKIVIPSKLFTGTASQDTPSRGAGYARNQAVKLREKFEQSQKPTRKPMHHFLCILDSDDIMHPTRIAEQTYAMLALGFDNDSQHLCNKTLMGCQFDRIPKDSTWHYQNWANSLSDERVYLEQFRECTLIQPTWFFSKDWFISLGGYLEAPEMLHEKRGMKRKLDNSSDEMKTQHYQLVHSSELMKPPDASSGTETTTLRLAEDLRLFYAHLHSSGYLHLHRTSHPLVSYRHRSGMSQSSSTPRKLLLKLRAKAWEDLVYYGRRKRGRSSYCTIWSKNGFAIWGAGRDGKDFLKALSPDVAASVVCFVDVDKKKIEEIKWYDNPALGKRIPIWHFSVLRSSKSNASVSQAMFGRIDKRKASALSHLQNHFVSDQESYTDQSTKVSEKMERQHATSDLNNSPITQDELTTLPVVVCVAMYRTSGAMESNVASIGRIEGENLWHMS